MARVRGADYIHSGSQRKAAGRVWIYLDSLTGQTLNISLDIPHLSFVGQKWYRIATYTSTTHTRHTSRLIPSGTSRVYLIPILAPHELAFQPRPTSHTMSENSTINPNPETILTNSLPPLLESRVCEAERMLQCLEVSTPRRSVGPEDMEWEGILAGPVEVIPSGREEEEVLVFDLPCAIIEGERGGEERLIGKQKCEGDRIVELEHEIERVRGLHREEVQKKTQHIQAVEEQLKQTKELLAMKSAELSGAHAFLSTTDRLSEVEVLGIIRDLNENIYQVAVNLTDEWEKLEPSRATSRMDVDPTSRPHVPALVQRVLSRDPVGLTFLLQSCLCSQVVKITSSWGHHRRLAILESVYKRLFASGEHHIIDVRLYVTYMS